MANPKLYQLDSPEFAKQLNILCLKAKKRKKQQQKLPINWQGKETFEFEEYRQYNPGDDLRRVDWNIYSRLQEIVIKEYEIDPPQHLVILLDISKSMDVFDKLQYAKALSAALVYIGSTLLDKVTFMYFSHAQKSLRSFSNNRNIFPFFSSLQSTRPSQDATSLKDCFHQFKLLNSTNINTVVISDFYTQEYFTSMRMFRGACTAVQVVSEQELHPQLSGNMCFEDAENNHQHSLFIDKERLKVYHKNFHGHLSHVKNHCWQHKINYLLSKKHDVTFVLNILQTAGFIR